MRRDVSLSVNVNVCVGTKDSVKELLENAEILHCLLQMEAGVVLADELGGAIANAKFAQVIVQSVLEGLREELDIDKSVITSIL